MHNLFEQLGEALNPRTAQDIYLSVNKDLSIKAEQQSFSSAYRESISNIAVGIYNATNSLLEFLTQPQVYELEANLYHKLKITEVYKKRGQWFFNRGEEGIKTLHDLETADVLTIMEITEKIILAA